MIILGMIFSVPRGLLGRLVASLPGKAFAVDTGEEWAGEIKTVLLLTEGGRRIHGW